MVDSNQFVTDLTTIGGGTAHMIGYAQNAGAGYIEAPNNTQQADGVVPLDRLPAQWWNWFLNQSTRRFSEYETYLENIVAELDGVLDILGITPDAGDPSTVNQLKTMFASNYLQDYLPEIIAAASSFSADATHENHILVADDDGNSGYSVKKVPYAPGFILNTQLSSAAKTLTLPANCPFDGETIKICFANGHEASNSTDYMTLNVNSTGPVPIVSNQNGTLNNLPIHELTAGTYSVLMANVTLEMYYTSNGFNSNPAWVVIGNPVVLSSTDYTIYADGYIDDDTIYKKTMPLDNLISGVASYTWHKHTVTVTLRFAVVNSIPLGTTICSNLPDVALYQSGTNYSINIMATSNQSKVDWLTLASTGTSAQIVQIGHYACPTSEDWGASFTYTSKSLPPFAPNS